MRIAVCIKTVVDPLSRIDLDEEGRLRPGGLRFEVNEYDLYAVEEAIRIAEAADGEVLLISVGNDDVVQALRKGLAMGADRALQVNCETATLDAHGTAELLAAALVAQRPDLVLAGVESDDLGGSQVGVLLAEAMGYASTTLAVAIEVGDDNVRVRRELEGGQHSWVEVQLPAVVTIQTGINEPRYPSLKGIMAAKRKELTEMTLEALGLAEPPRPRVETLGLAPPPPRERARIIEGSPEEAAAELVRILRQEEKVL